MKFKYKKEMSKIIVLGGANLLLSTLTPYEQGMAYYKRDPEKVPETLEDLQKLSTGESFEKTMKTIKDSPVRARTLLPGRSVLAEERPKILRDEDLEKRILGEMSRLKKVHPDMNNKERRRRARSAELKGKLA